MRTTQLKKIVTHLIPGVQHWEWIRQTLLSMKS